MFFDGRSVRTSMYSTCTESQRRKSPSRRPRSALPRVGACRLINSDTYAPHGLTSVAPSMEQAERPMLPVVDRGTGIQPVAPATPTPIEPPRRPFADGGVRHRRDSTRT
jgi:hypothetical protein